MPAQWNKSKNLKPKVIINQVLESASLLSDGRVSYTGNYFEYKSVLKSMIEFVRCNLLSPDTLESCFNAALDNYTKLALTTKNQGEAEFIEQVNEQIKKHLRHPTIEFHIVTALSISGALPVKKLVIDKATITLHPSGIPRKYKSRNEFNDRWSKSFTHTPEHYAGAVVSVRARNYSDAFHTALDALDFVRGVLCFYSVPGMSISLMGRRTGPINLIRLGGMHTVHKSDGALATDQYWYEVDERPEKTFTFSTEKQKGLGSSIRKIIKRINSISGGERIREGIIRYTRALDEKDSDYAIIKLWGALESTVNENDNSDIIIRRCSYLYSDHELVRQILETSKLYRNRNVHAGVSSPEADQICYQIHRIFKSLILFYVGNKEFKSLKEANTFLDSPLMDGDIDRQIYLLKKAVRFRNSGKP